MNSPEGKEKKNLIGAPANWLAIVATVVLLVVSAAAQEVANPKPVTSPTPQAEKPSQPPTASSHSAVDIETYVIGESDMLDISVWKDKELSRTIPVRPDGKISLPLIGEIQASGRTPVQLQNDITQRLKAFIEHPEVAVIVADPRSHHFNVVGQVAKPGTYSLSQSMTVLDAISSAGGFRDFAKETKIYVLRTTPSGAKTRLPFNYKDAIKGKNPQNNIVLLPGDTIVVP